MRILSILSAISIMASQVIPAWGDQLQDALNAVDKKDFNRAYQLFRPLAENGNKLAQEMLGELYNNGAGVAKDEKAAVTWWRRAAEKGEPYAQLRLGESFAVGRGVQEDFAEAAKWLRKAAEQNITKAQTGLGLALYQG
jgi:uncharacterized protein